jgi:uncharacterized damage-inducible protein DinB
MSDPRYPIGPYVKEETVSAAKRETWIGEIADTPGRMRAAVQGLNESQFETPYRDGGWTVRQLVHHVPDSHLNAYLRFKLALTEDNPAIKTYEESLWARLPDTAGTQIGVSLMLLEALHRRWVVLLRAMQEAEWSRTYVHPEQGRVRLDYILGMYAWHGKHHVAHIISLRDRMGWS